VKLLDAGRAPHGPYLVLELLRGRTLGARLRDGPLPLTEALRVAVLVARGVAHAHARGVVHRDLTPGNVFLCDDGGVKLLDLGMAHAFGHRLVAGGTPRYMAPEQRREAPEDERTDVFSLGVVLFQMITHKLPFPERHEDASHPRHAPALDAPSVPGLGPLVARMLAQDPVSRPRDGGEVLAALESFRAELERSPAVPAPVRVRRRAGRGAATRPGPRARRASVAVLPFADLSPARDQATFVQGLGEELLEALGKVEGLHVKDRAQSASSHPADADPFAFGRRLEAAAVLHGSVRRAERHLRVGVRLVSVRDKLQLWAQTFDREPGDALAIQEEVARVVADAVAAVLLRRPCAPASETGLEGEAGRRYVLGCHFAERGTPEDLLRAVKAFHEALELAPTFAPARAALAAAQARRLELEAGRVAERDAAPEASPARSPDPASDTPGASEAWEWAASARVLDRELVLYPEDASGHLRRGCLFAAVGQLFEAVSSAHHAAALEPLNAEVWWRLGTFHVAMHHLDFARPALDRALELAPDHVRAGLERGLCDFYERDTRAATQRFEGSCAPWAREFGRALVWHQLGDPVGSDAALAALVEAGGGPVEIAEVHAWRGDLDAAFRWLERAAAQHDSGLERLKYSRLLGRIREDARFRALLRRLNLPLV
jgi:TolB-like protein/tetratricopeptide (TPR) repeat protein